MIVKPQLNVAMIGYKFMGRAHANAWRQAPRFFDLAARPHLQLVCGRDGAEAAAAAETLGFAEYVTDWRDVVAREDIDIVDICVPGHLHHDIVIEAARHGKAILCEKPLANTLDQCRAMHAAVSAAGVTAMVCHNYRRVPAVVLAKELVDAGEIGQIYHYRGTYLQDWIADPAFPLVWRLQKAFAGSGALGDISSHAFDLARFLVGEVSEVSAMLTTFVPERPLEDGSGTGRVDVDDAAIAMLRFACGATGTVESSRVASGRKNQNRFEINGSKGSIVFDLERMNELEVYREEGPNSGFRTIQVTGAASPYGDHWWPAGHIIGYEHSFIHTVADFVDAIAYKRPIYPDFADGVAVQLILDAATRSDASGRWVPVEHG